ncbi:MAG: hypothetical protein V2J55_01325 [Candidatus Competibacteraceae bacterium]|jgi:intracellular multiplication protein IcmP|nr:hypothetical protein [Candidatus Competibacteraceae bacterium]
MDNPRDPYDEIFIIAVLLLAPFVLWWLCSDVLVMGMFRLKLAQLWLVEAVWGSDTERVELARALRGALTAPDQISFTAFTFGLDAVGRYLRLPVCLALLLLSGYLLAFHPAEQFRRHFDLHRLAETQGGHWPFALHALRRGNLDLALGDPQWGMALSAREFAERYALLEDAPERNETRGATINLRSEPTIRVLAEQLGEPWAQAPLHAQALAGIFALRIASLTVDRDKDAERLKQNAFAALRDLAHAAARHKAGGYLPPPKAYQHVIQETKNALHDAEILTSQHAYTQTVLLRLLFEARQGGGLPPALFTWLKGVDRSLWFALSSLGRRVPFVEALGAMAHYQVECAFGDALPSPCVDAAVEALQAELLRTSHRPSTITNP